MVWGTSGAFTKDGQMQQSSQGAVGQGPEGGGGAGVGALLRGSMNKSGVAVGAGGGAGGVAGGRGLGGGAVGGQRRSRGRMKRDRGRMRMRRRWQGVLLPLEQSHVSGCEVP